MSERELVSGRQILSIYFPQDNRIITFSDVCSIPDTNIIIVRYKK